MHGFGTRWSDSLGSSGNLATLHQVHSDIVVNADGRSGCLGDGDALIANTPGSLVGVKTADCIPLLFVDPVHRAVGAVHAGWRGTASRIAARAVAKMAGTFGTRPEELHVAIGPGIGKCCYQVGHDVAAQFAEYDSCLCDSTQPVFLDLGEINRTQLRASGVDPSRIYFAGLCTKCNQDFHSFRRDREQAGRMFSVAGIE